MENTETVSSGEVATDTKDILVVASKVKKYVRDRAEMNTAGNVGEVLSDRVRTIINKALESAKADGRKTLKDRDFACESACACENTAAASDKDVLVVASKVKKYVRDVSGMNTAGNVGEVLSDKIRVLIDQALECAKADGRKTLKDRDFV